MMNRLSKKKFANQVGMGFILWMVCFAALICGAGVGIGMLKNKTLNVRRNIESIEVDINSCQKTSEHYKYKIASNCSRWAMRDRLVQNQSALVEIDPARVEYIKVDNERIVASRR